jgi:nitrogen fixation NifU-like protein
MGKYSDVLMDHFTSPRNSGSLESPDVTGHAGAPGRGPFLILYLRIAEGQVAAAKFQTYGCGPTIACGSMLTELITGRPIAECLELTPDALSQALEGVPADKLHSPALAIAALRDALRSYSPALCT